MAYGNFTLHDVKRQFHLTIDEDTDLFSLVEEIEARPFLTETLHDNIPLALAIHTEKARSELIIAPILVELRKLVHRQIGLFSGADFSVAPEQGLNGVCDFIISQSAEQFFIAAPVLIVVEAKNENIKGGLGQCLAAMVAARLFNERDGNAIPAIYGVVTSGSNWRFLKLQGETAFIDCREYYIERINKILGILLSIVGNHHKLKEEKEAA